MFIFYLSVNEKLNINSFAREKNNIPEMYVYHILYINIELIDLMCLYIMLEQFFVFFS